jgi:choline-sulfatase
MTSGISRRRFIQGTAAAAATVGLSQFAQAGTSWAQPCPPPPPFTPRGRLRNRPNFLYIMCDEYRFPVAYESQALMDFRAEYLTAEVSLRENGLEFMNHYIMSSACQPSRASIFTGQYPSLHGVSQTSGAAKSAWEQDLYWLPPNTVPTMGNFFRAGGYDTYYKGKWHVTDADLLIPGTHSQLLSFDDEGNPIPSIESIYEAAESLHPFGFSGWIGPEPHGSDPLNSGSSATDAIGRDVKFASEVVDLIQTLGGATNPWLLVASFVNPHDISLWGDITLQNSSFNLMGQLAGTKVPEQMFNTAQYLATSQDDLSNKPTCQSSYVETYPDIFQPLTNTTEYRQFYYQLQQNVNEDIQSVLNALAANPQLAANTIVIFTSDHGDQIGAHGGMYQKWYQAYEETTHVPFIVNNPTLFPEPQTLEGLTSHADLIPTMLGLAGLDPNELLSYLASNHTEVQPLVGRDLSGVILGEVSPDTVTDPVYFMTDDDVSRGAQQTTFTGVMYPSVLQPNHLETVVAMLPTGANGALQKWKYSRYYDNPQFWSGPGGAGLIASRLPPIFESVGVSKDVVTLVGGNMNLPGPKTANTTVKILPVQEEREAYNVTEDPLELVNLANSSDPAIEAILVQLEQLLHQQCEAKRLKPTSGTVPAQPNC